MTTTNKEPELMATISRLDHETRADELLRQELRKVALLMRAELDALLACDLASDYADDTPPTEQQRVNAWDAVNEGLKAAVSDCAECVHERFGIDGVDVIIGRVADSFRRHGFGSIGKHSGVEL